jgi:riboflavin biosynthesis pyrimidine reductase
MQRLWPEPGEVGDVVGLVAAEARPAPGDRPWVLVNMVASLDGAIAVDGRSGGLGGPADKAMFSALRGVADVVLVGAGTARAEGYGPARPSDATRSARRARGQADAPPIALVTRSLDLDLTTPLFAETTQPTIVITCASADAARRAAVAHVADLIVAGHDAVDLHAALAELAARGAGVVTCEGGPSLNGQLVAADLIDEWDLTVSPRLVSGGTGRSSHGPAPLVPTAMRLDRILEDDGFLLTRWLRDRDRRIAAPNTSI